MTFDFDYIKILCRKPILQTVLTITEIFFCLSFDMNSDVVVGRWFIFILPIYFTCYVALGFL